MKPQRREDERNERLDGVMHVALPRKTLADPVAERAALRHAAPYIGQRATAHQHVVGRAKDEERVGGILPRFFLIALDTPAKCPLGELIVRPYWLPGRKERATLAAQPRPVRVVADPRVT